MNDHYLSDHDIRYLERELEEDYDEEPPHRESKWTTATREQVPIYAMTDKHLLATIRVLRGKSPIGTKWSGDYVRRRGMAERHGQRGLRTWLKPR